jgi:hypothetical protein
MQRYSATASYRYQLTNRYLAAAARMEDVCGERLREFSSAVNDDDEVRGLFGKQAEDGLRRVEVVLTRLKERGGEPERQEEGLSSVFTLAPALFQPGDATEERLVQNLMVGYAAERGLCGLYELVGAASQLESDSDTTKLAAQLQAEHENSARELFHLLPSRSKIAFNMLTVSEVDPSVETKMADDRLVGS